MDGNNETDFYNVTDSNLMDDKKVTDSNVTDSSIIDSLLGANNVTDSNVTDFYNATDSNLMDDKKVTDSNVTDSSIIDSNNVTDSNVTDSSIIDSNNVTDSSIIDSNNVTDSLMGASDLTDSNNLTNSNNLTSQDNFNDKAFYIQIKSFNNKTNFIPDKVTLTQGDKIIWLNHDNSEHKITVGSDSRTGYQLLNSPILPNGTIEHQFQLSGTYYSVLDDLVSEGSITILDRGNETNAISIPLED
jgi:plastocyanin